MASRSLEVLILGSASSLKRAFGQSAAAAEGFRAKLSSFGTRATAIGRSMTRGLTLPLAAAGAASVVLATQFETSMSKVEGLVGVSRSQVDAWSKDLLRLAPQVAKSPRELADALFFVTSAGLKGSDAIDALTQSARASSAGLGETATVADAVTSAMNAYGPSVLNAERATDILVSTVREGKAEAPALAAAIGKVLPIASQMGVRFDEVGASVAAMTRTGTEANVATTQLRAILVGLLKPTAGAAKAMKDVGLSSEGLRKQLREKGLLSVLQTLKGAVGDNDAAMAKIFPNVRALAGVLDLTGANAEDAAAIFASLTDTTGATDRAFATAADTGAFKMRQALAHLQAAGIQIGSVLLPILASIAAAVGRLAERFSNLSPSTQKVIVIMALLVAAIGPLLLIIGTLAVAIAALSGPMLIAIGATAALVAAFAVAGGRSKSFRDTVSRAWEGLRRAVASVITWFKANIVPTFTAITNAARAVWDTFGGAITSLARTHFNAVLGVVKPLLVILREAIELVLALIRGDWSEVWSSLKEIARNALRAAVEVVRGLASVFVAAARLLGLAVWEGIKAGLQAVSNLNGALSGLARSGIAAAAAAARGAAASIGGAIWRGISGSLSGLAGQLASLLRGAVQSAVSSAVSSISPVSIASSIGSKIRGAVPGLASGGIVSTPTFSLLGEAGPEAVVPLTRPSRARAVLGEAGLMGGGGRGVTINNNIIINALDPQAAGAAVAKALREYTRRNGPIVGVAA